LLSDNKTVIKSGHTHDGHKHLVLRIRVEIQFEMELGPNATKLPGLN